MNVTITPRGQPQRTELYSGVTRVYSDGETLYLMGRVLPGVFSFFPIDPAPLPLKAVAEIALDEDGGA